MGEPVNSLRLANACRLAKPGFKSGALPALFALFAGLAIAFCAPRSAQAANDSAMCTVRIIHAKHEGGAVDPKLEPLKAQLTHPPLSAWKSFHLLRSDDLQLRALSSAPFAVPGDHQGSLEFLGTVEGNGKQRLRLRLQIMDGGARLLNTVFVIDNGGTVLQAGIKHEQGLLVLGFTCKLGS